MKRSFQKRTLFVLLAVVLSLSFSLPAFAEGFNQDVKRSTVLVLTEIETTEGTLYSWGTGFFVGKGGQDPQYLLTNYHVVEEFLSLGGGGGIATLSVVYEGKMVFKKVIGLDQGGQLSVSNQDAVLSKTDYEEAYFIAGDAAKDIALLKIGKTTNKRIPLAIMLPDDSFIGKMVYAVGYPGSTEYTVNSVASFSVDGVSVTSGNVSRFITEAGVGRELLQTNVSISGGNSGGPLVDSNGAVLGLNTLGSKLDSNLFYAVSINEAIPLLRNNNIDFDFYSAKTGSMPYLLIGAAILAAAVLIVLVVLLVRNNRRKAAATMAAVGANAQEPAFQQISSLQTSLTPTLHSTAAQHGGMALTLSRQPVTIGRDVAACRIVFKEGTPGISSKHCQIYFDESSSTFVLTDLKSTYGTFLSSGQRVTPGVPYTLKQRDSFYLGEQDNAFYVDMR